MMKRLAIGVVVLLLVAGAGIAILARSVLTGDHVRQALASQLSSALGQPVTVGGVEASVFPRITIDLRDVAIGDASRIQLQSVHLGTNLRALFSRRIEHAVVRVDGARLALPLPDMQAGGTAASGDPTGASDPPLEIVSVDEIVLTDVELISGGRTLNGDVELVPDGDAIHLRRVSLVAGDTALEMTGTLTSLSPVEGRIEASAREADFDRLLVFLSDFASSATSQPTTDAEAESGLGRLAVDMSVERASAGGLSMSDLRASATVTPDTVTLDPLTLDVFGGRYEGAMVFAVQDVPRFTWRARVNDLDAAQLMAFAETPDTISGRLSGTLALEGEGLEMERALRTARGTARVDITDGTVAGLSLVRTIVTATSGRGGLATSARAALESRSSGEGEQFSRLGATLALADGRMATNDLALISPDVELSASGTVTLASMTTEMTGEVQLSDELSKEAGTDLYRYTQEEGRVTLPATVTGPMDNLAVRIDFTGAASRAIRNRAVEEVQDLIERNLPERLRLPRPRRPPGW